MNEYVFQLYYQLPESEPDPEAWLDALFEAGCDDALVGVAVAGHTALDFTRQAQGPLAALRSAIDDVERAIPNGRLVCGGPDLLHLSELSALLSERLSKVSRQAMRKYATGDVRRIKTRFPSARVSGSTPLWHLDEVIKWMRHNGKFEPEMAESADALIELSAAIRTLNALDEYAASRAAYPDLAEQALDLARS
mgnify:FL=1